MAYGDRETESEKKRGVYMYVDAGGKELQDSKDASEEKREWVRERERERERE